MGDRLHETVSVRGGSKGRPWSLSLGESDACSRRGHGTPFPRVFEYEYEYEHEYEYDGGIRGSSSFRTRTCLSPQRGPGIQPRGAGAWRPMPWGDPPRIRAMKGHSNRSIAGW